MLHAPACGKLSGTECDTDTRPLCGALAEDLKRHLRSLRSKRAKSRKSSAKRAREKDRSSNLAFDWGRETSLKNNLKSLRESPRNDKKRKKESAGQGGVCTCVCPCVCMNASHS